MINRQTLFSEEKLVNAEYKVSKVSSFAEVWESAIGGEKALHATVTLSPGDIICSFVSKQVLTEANYLSVQVNEHEHILLNPEFLQYINHSCEPNVFFDTKNMMVTCLRPIEIGEEMTFFYPSTEWQMSRPFKCFCQSPACLGYIQGAAHLQPKTLQKYKLTHFIQQKL
ncbi:MAG: SET domain-containing protein-lysine N-methyltransferase [Rhizonema sp. PD37]|nr:SET domain-containing protein-lysine N-methyltransferase [Rhizonema sp. PD37]